MRHSVGKLLARRGAWTLFVVFGPIEFQSFYEFKN